MKRFALVAMVSLVASGAVRAEPPRPQRPFNTLLPWSLDAAEWEVAAGVVHRREVHPPFFGDEPGTSRDEWRFSFIDLARGLGAGGELQLRFGLQSFDEEGGLDESGIEDARIAVAYQLRSPRRVAVALRLGVKLPNASDEDRLGTDQTDVSLLGSVGRAGHRWGWAGNAGLGILGHPLEAGVQDDVALFGAAGWYNLETAGVRTPIVAEISGAAASRFSNDFRLLRVGMMVMKGRISIDFSVRRGLTSESEEWGLEAGVTWAGTN